VLTPVTPLNKLLRVRPCRARTLRSSLSRTTCSSSPSCRTLTFGGTGTAAVPRGPLISTTSGFTATLTPWGSFTGSRPMRDIASPSSSNPRAGPASPHRAQHLAADVALARHAVGQDALGSREDAHAETAADARRGVGADVDPQARLAHPLEAGDHRAALRV